MTLHDFKGKKVTVMGIGLHGGGLGVINFFYQAGAKIIATDLRTRRELRESLDALRIFKGIRYVLGQHREEDFKNTDLVIKNPAVPDDSKYLKIARAAGVPVETDIGIFFELCPGQIIGVTGSRGKSTTAALIHQFLKAKHPDTVLAGNIRMSVLEKLQEIQRTTLVVLELSSWQLNGLAKHKKSPKMAVMTNFMPDHQNRYRSMKKYLEDKKIIYKFQTAKDFLILNYDDETLKKLVPEVKSKIYYYSADAQAVTELENLPKTNQETRIGARLSGDKIFFGAAKEPIAAMPDIKLLGEHNLHNILAAVTVARLFNVPVRIIKKILQEFPGLQGRLELVSEINGIKYFNDTTATIPEATIAAIEALTNRYSLAANQLILIAGGADKNLNFSELARLITKKTKAVLLLAGTATHKLGSEIKKHIFALNQNKKSRSKLIIKIFNNLPFAVTFASKIAEKEDIILLSPGCASFGMFRHEFERGEIFNDAVASLKND
ncbi:MAG: UDP-N-acetylmuramoylalanine--D-glutamate ligase [Candidatus Portnoybacteria bacterium RBG_19FT_COMBO_36_7]|uniref:UDP-N-acetylmuramoylalanine--D-glutamate ligase n=1 Tax=Candidatus Portnoybacteria bacterium RBG_19FT_COMBO_36_7 TaxID=1801992 RepID=A0A1G2F8W0_9BACT|nr:MAG: UDP-N-acetylmuramoylalanine--D-glutamate ligase [Candidatus Portnoybacteria bacterium RBG_19FT_COMBO_36_7]